MKHLEGILFPVSLCTAFAFGGDAAMQGQVCDSNPSDHPHIGGKESPVAMEGGCGVSRNYQEHGGYTSAPCTVE